MMGLVVKAYFAFVFQHELHFKKCSYFVHCHSP